MTITPTQADIDQADRFTNPKDDPHLHNILVKSFAAHAQATRDEMAEKFQTAIEDGYPAPKNKVDTCEHGKFGWEDCITCYDEHLLAAIRALKSGCRVDG